MKIAVFAGTPVDTQMGVKLLEENGYDTISYPMAQSAKEQTEMQYYSLEVLNQLFEKKLEEAVDQGVGAALIYCNSLSAAVDYTSLSEKFGIPIITPIESYRNIAKKHQSVAILAANSFSAYHIDEMMCRENPNLKTITFGMMNLVEAIERGESSEEIVKSLNLKGLLSYLLGISRSEDQIEAILLGCTHFPYVKNELVSFLKEILSKDQMISLYDPDQEILKDLKLAYEAWSERL